MSSAGRHYRAARASAAAASSQKPARAPVVRGHTPSRRAPPPPAFRSERAPPSAAGWLSAVCHARPPLLSGAATEASVAGGVHPAGPTTGALARRGGGRGRSPSAAAGASLGTSGKLRPVPRAARPVPCRPTGRRAAVRGSLRPDAWRIFLVGCGVWAAGPRGGAAGAVRLHLLSESPSRVGGRRSDPGGDAGLSAIIGEDAVPCPTGAVVSPLKKPEPHCSLAVRIAVALPGEGERARPNWLRHPT